MRSYHNFYLYLLYMQTKFKIDLDQVNDKPTDRYCAPTAYTQETRFTMLYFM